MGNSDFKICATCGKSYKPCVNCEEYAGKGNVFWRATCDTPECWQAHVTIHAYYHKQIDKEQAKKELKISLNDGMKPYNENVRVIIDEILREEAVVAKPVKENVPRQQGFNRYNKKI